MRGDVHSHVLLLQPREPPILCRFGCQRIADAIGAPAVVLFSPGERNLVLGVCLNGAAELQRSATRPCSAARRATCRGRRVHLVAFVRVLVEKHARGLTVRDRVPAGRPEPETVADDRAAERQVQIDIADHFVRRADAQRPQPIGHVVADHRLVRERKEIGARERVAAIPRDEVDAHAAGRQICVHSSGVDGDFRGGANVGRGPADVAARLQRR